MQPVRQSEITVANNETDGCENEPSVIDTHAPTNTPVPTRGRCRSPRRIKATIIAVTRVTITVAIITNAESKAIPYPEGRKIRWMATNMPRRETIAQIAPRRAAGPGASATRSRSHQATLVRHTFRVRLRSESDRNASVELAIVDKETSWTCFKPVSLNEIQTSGRGTAHRRLRVQRELLGGFSCQLLEHCSAAHALCLTRFLRCVAKADDPTS
jgi:hypothetical protein